MMELSPFLECGPRSRDQGRLPVEMGSIPITRGWLLLGKIERAPGTSTPLRIRENVESPAKYGIRGIPTLILFKGGQEVDRHVGIPSNAMTSIAQMIEKQLA